MDIEQKEGHFRAQLGPLLFLTALFFLNFIARIILAPMMPGIEEELHITHAQAGSLFLFISFGYFVALTGSGFFSSRLMHHRTIVVSATAVAVALFVVAMSRGLWELRLGLLLLGMAAGIYLPSGIATLTALVSSRNWGKAVAVHELAPNVSFIAAPLISEALLIWVSWRNVLMVLGSLSLLLGLAYARYGREGRFPGQPPSFGALKSLFSDRAFWIMMVLFGLGISGSLGVYTMLPLYLVTEHGMNRNWANTLVAFSRLSGLAMTFVSGWLADRLNPRTTIGLVLLLGGLSTALLGLLPSPWIPYMVFIQPAVAVCFFPPGFAALSSIGPADSRNIAVSFTVPAAFILGGGATPSLIGAIGDTYSFSLGLVLIGGLICTGIYLLRYLQLPRA